MKAPRRGPGQCGLTGTTRYVPTEKLCQAVQEATGPQALVSPRTGLAFGFPGHSQAKFSVHRLPQFSDTQDNTGRVIGLKGRTFLSQEHLNTMKFLLGEPGVPSLGPLCGWA